MAIQIQREEPIKPGEWHDVLWHQYMNCVDSLKMQNAESRGGAGTTRFESYPSWEAFEGNVRILAAMCEGYDLIDGDFRKAHGQDDSTVLFTNLTRELKKKEFWKEGRPYLGRI